MIPPVSASALPIPYDVNPLISILAAIKNSPDRAYSLFIEHNSYLCPLERGSILNAAADLKHTELVAYFLKHPQIVEQEMLNLAIGGLVENNQPDLAIDFMQIYKSDLCREDYISMQHLAEHTEQPNTIEKIRVYIAPLLAQVNEPHTNCDCQG